MGSKQQGTDLWSQQGYKWLVGVCLSHMLVKYNLISMSQD